MKRLGIAAAAAVAALAAACGPNSNAEKAGENADSAVEETFQGERNLGDGPLERAGEGVDDAAGTSRQDGLDSLNDAADADKTTTP